MIERPLVSVIMPTYNEAPHIIHAALESILLQTWRNWELLVLDDSTEAMTSKAIDDIAETDDRVRVVREKSRMGFVHALNVGIGLSRGEYIARMDGDDVSLPERLASQIEYMRNHPDTDAVGGAMYLMDESGTIRSERHYPCSGLRMNLFTIFRSPLAHPTVMIRRSITDAGFRYDEKFPMAEDLEFWLRLRKRGYRLANMDVCLLNYRCATDMAGKRSRKQFRWNLKARVKNISVRYLFYDLFSICVAAFYSILPSRIVSFCYSVENRS